MCFAGHSSDNEKVKLEVSAESKAITILLFIFIAVEKPFIRVFHIEGQFRAVNSRLTTENYIDILMHNAYISRD